MSCTVFELTVQALYCLSTGLLLALYLLQILQGVVISSASKYAARPFHLLGFLGCSLAAAKATDPWGCHRLLSVIALWALDDNMVNLLVTCAFGTSFTMVYLAYELLGKVQPLGGQVERPRRFRRIVVMLVVPLFLIPNVMLVLEGLTDKEWYRGIQQITYAFSLTAFIICITYARHRFLFAYRNLFPKERQLFPVNSESVLSFSSSTVNAGQLLDSSQQQVHRVSPAPFRTGAQLDELPKNTPPNHLLSSSELRIQHGVLADIHRKVQVWVSWVFPIAVLLCVGIIIVLSWQGTELFLESHNLPLPPRTDLLDVIYSWVIQVGFALVLWFSWVPVRNNGVCCPAGAIGRGRSTSDRPRRRVKSQSYVPFFGASSPDSRRNTSSESWMDSNSRVDLGSYTGSAYDGMVDDNEPVFETDNGSNL
eukprot:gb/GEZN01003991.1/.p1 GENE.gb/GEZN01003991.1/~~gb/GEZN01003991.1/.p1  ORF type:complete len:423 (+),score=30.58 gb/GEZN01003991.1/:649-1917(+)